MVSDVILTHCVQDTKANANAAACDESESKK